MESRGPAQVALALLVLGALAWPACAEARTGATGGERRCSPAGIRALHGTARVERRVRCLINARRAHHRLRPLRYDRCLDRAAERHARDMVRRRYFAHASRRGRTPAQRARAAGYVPSRGRWRIGENLAWGAGGRASARAAVRGWLDSPPHRANLLGGGFRDVGVAVVNGAPVRGAGGRHTPTATFVVEFGTREGPGCGSARAGKRRAGKQQAGRRAGKPRSGKRAGRPQAGKPRSGKRAGRPQAGKPRSGKRAGRPQAGRRADRRLRAVRPARR